MMTYALIALLVALQLADIWTTYRFLKLGTAKEGNPIARKLFALIGFWPTCLLKLVLTVPMAAALLIYPGNPNVIIPAVFMAGLVAVTVVENADHIRNKG